MKPHKCERTGVWMVSEHESAARAVAVSAMMAMGLDHTDFRERDKVIIALSTLVTQLLDGAAGVEVIDEAR